MANNGFDNLRTDNWLAAGVIYSYFSLLAVVLNYDELILQYPVFGAIVQIISIIILIYAKKKGHKFRVAINISLVLNSLMLMFLVIFIVALYF